MFYITNWGTWQFLFRFPLGLVDPAWFQPYCLPDAIATHLTPDYLILNITIQEEESMGLWVEGEGWLPRPVTPSNLEPIWRTTYPPYRRLKSRTFCSSWCGVSPTSIYS
jgi:hypothetical protein